MLMIYGTRTPAYISGLQSIPRHFNVRDVKFLRMQLAIHRMAIYMYSVNVYIYMLPVPYLAALMFMLHICIYT